MPRGRVPGDSRGLSNPRPVVSRPVHLSSPASTKSHIYVRQVCTESPGAEARTPAPSYSLSLCPRRPRPPPLLSRSFPGTRVRRAGAQGLFMSRQGRRRALGLCHLFRWPRRGAGTPSGTAWVAGLSTLVSQRRFWLLAPGHGDIHVSGLCVCSCACLSHSAMRTTGSDEGAGQQGACRREGVGSLGSSPLPRSGGALVLSQGLPHSPPPPPHKPDHRRRPSHPAHLPPFPSPPPTWEASLPMSHVHPPRAQGWPLS